MFVIPGEEDEQPARRSAIPSNVSLAFFQSWIVNV